MNAFRRITVFAVAGQLALAAPATAADEAVDLEIATRIRQEAFARSQVMDLARELTDGFGPRLTGSPELAKANAWAKDKLASWGLANAQVEPWGPFGEGWTLERASAHQVEPWAQPLTVVARAWAPGTDGPVRGAAVVVKLDSEEDLAKHKGKLAGKVLLLGEPAPVPLGEKPALDRYDERELEELARFETGGRRAMDPARREQFMRRWALRRKIAAFLVEEKVAAVLDPAGTDGQVRTMSTRPREKGDPGVPWLHVRAEQWNRMARLVQAGRTVEVEVDVRVKFAGGADAMDANVLADLPGSDKRGELVMLGAHIDSWHAATGAADNAAGVAVVMEAMRILKSLGVTPKRTIRVGLWSGEEQGLLGARAHVAKHFASRPPAPANDDTPSFMRRPSGPLTVHAGHGLLSAYFNLDNGSGKIRGIYAQQNVAAAKLFERWLEPYRDLGATTVTLRDTGSTDHVPFDEVGLPGFQFIQDDIEYESRTHHRNLDEYDRLQEADLKQAAAVMAGFVWQAATRPDRLPRKPMPKDEPTRPAAAR